MFEQIRRRLRSGAISRVDPAEWVSVGERPVDNPRGSELAADAVAQLRAAGIEAREEPHVLSDPVGQGIVGVPSAESRVLFSVLVRRTDRGRAEALLGPGGGAPIGEADLAEQAAEAGRPIPGHRRRPGAPDGEVYADEIDGSL